MDVLPLLTRSAVIAAINEFDRLGRGRFLSKYGIRDATTHLLLYRGHEYDAKAIVSVAHRFLPSVCGPLTRADRSVDGKRVTLPRRAIDRPSQKALQWHIKNSRARKAL